MSNGRTQSERTDDSVSTFFNPFKLEKEWLSIEMTKA